MESNFGQHGWREFHQNRENILSEFDKLVIQTKNRPVRTAHGNGVEASIRRWLSEFLPKKYGVTSGYIISNLYASDSKVRHFDIIIYDQLESPILWTEGNADDSEQGKHRAIPAKYVVALYEVKARLNKKNVNDALEKLSQTKEFCNQLHKNYTCGMFFVDLKESDTQSEVVLKDLCKGATVHGFSGGIVLRYEGDKTSTGIISCGARFEDEQNNTHCKPLAKPIDSLDIYLTEEGNLTLAERGGGATLVATSQKSWSVSKHYGVTYTQGTYAIRLDWSRSNFSRFFIELLSTLEGIPFDPNDKNRPSFGMVFDRIDIKKAPLQPLSKSAGKPHLIVSPYAGGGDGENVINSIEDNKQILQFWVTVENIGDVTAVQNSRN